MALGLLAAACGSDSDGASTAPPAASQPEQTDSTTADIDAADGSATAPTSPQGSATTAAEPAVPEALQFTAPLVGGGEFNGADYAGKPTVFWFWAPT